MGMIQDLWDALTGKAAKEKKRAEETLKDLQKKVAELNAEKEKLEHENSRLKSDLKKQEEDFKNQHEKDVKIAFWEGGQRKERELSIKGWEEKVRFKDLPQQEQMKEFLSHLVFDKILVQDQKKALVMLQNLMKSGSVDIMKPKDKWDADCLLENFLLSLISYGSEEYIKKNKDFYDKVFKVILNAKGKEGPKANLTCKLPNYRYPLIGYFGANYLLKPFLKTALNSAAFNIEEFDLKHFLQVERLSNGEWLEVQKQLLLLGYTPKTKEDAQLFEKASELVKDLPRPQKKIEDRVQRRLNAMSRSELLKTIKTGYIKGEITDKAKNSSENE